MSLLCPQCGKEFPEDEALWILAGRFYCTEACAKAASRAAVGLS